MLSPLAKVLTVVALAALALAGGLLWRHGPSVEAGPTPPPGPVARPAREATPPSPEPAPRREAVRTEPPPPRAPEVPTEKAPKEVLRILEFSVELESTKLPAGQTLDALLRVRNVSSIHVPVMFTLDPADGFVTAEIAPLKSATFRRCSNQNFQCRPIAPGAKLTVLKPGEGLSRQVNINLSFLGDDAGLTTAPPGHYTLRFVLDAGAPGGGKLRIEDIALTLTAP